MTCTKFAKIIGRQNYAWPNQLLSDMGFNRYLLLAFGEGFMVLGGYAFPGSEITALRHFLFNYE